MSSVPKSKFQSMNSAISSASTSSHHGSHHQNGSTSDIIQLLVDNATFVVNPEIFSYKKDTMLYRMFFSSPSIAKPNEKGQYVIEGFSATVFGAILVCSTLFGSIWFG